MENKSWIAAHLYCAEPWHPLIIKQLHPFIKQIMDDGLADQYFFIRYWEKGPHIRLRFFADNKVIEEQIKPAILKSFNAYFKANPSTRAYEHESFYPNDTVQFIDYEPETERYGGQEAIITGEKQFQASSSAVLEILKESETWSFENGLGAAIQMHLAFARALHLDKKVAAELFHYFYQGWLPSILRGRPNLTEEEQIKVLEDTKASFDKLYLEQKESLNPYVEGLWEALGTSAEFDAEWLNNWKKSMEEVRVSLHEFDEKEVLVTSLMSIYGSFLHMTNNRLGLLNQDEGYLGYLLFKSLESF